MLMQALDTFLRGKGTTYLSRADFKTALEKLKVADTVESAVAEGKIIACKKGKQLVFTLPRFFEAECNIVTNYYRLQKQMKYNRDVILKYIREAERNLNISLHEQQINAIINGITNNVAVVTGGAGTGKTSVLLAMMYCIRKLSEKAPRFSLTAPTGKASRRMCEATGMEACTLHKLLGLTEENTETQFFIPADVVIVDESSMVDLMLAEQLFNSVKTGAKLILVGDPNQLSSVGIGTVLKSLVLSKVVPVTQLTKTFRQDDSSTLFKNITAIKENGILESGNDFKMVQNNGDTTNTIINLYNQKVKEYGRDNVMVLLPYRKVGVSCTNQINAIVQKQVQCNNNPCCTVDNNHFFYVGDPVIQMENREVANGEVGKVVYADDNGITVQFVDCEIEYDKDEILDNISLAYAITVHKSQGSEAKCAICTCLNNEKAMLSKNLLYTAVTRAKKECVLLYDNEALHHALNTVEDEMRISLLEDKFQYTKRYMDFNRQALCRI